MTEPSSDLASQICGWLAGTGIELFELRGPGTLIRLQRNGTTYAVPPATVTADVVRSGSVGVLRLAHPLRPAPLVHVGDAVRAGQALAVLQLGAVLLSVAAPRDGVVRRILAADGSTIGYGEPLVELE